MSGSQHTPAYRAFTRRLREAREQSELTQREVARRLGKPQSFVAKSEQGERRVDVKKGSQLVERPTVEGQRAETGEPLPANGYASNLPVYACRARWPGAHGADGSRPSGTASRTAAASDARILGTV